MTEQEIEKLKIEITLPEGKESLNKQEIEDLFIRPYAEMVDKAFADYGNKINELQSQLREAVEILKEYAGEATRDDGWSDCVDCGSLIPSREFDERLSKFLQSVEGSKCK